MITAIFALAQNNLFGSKNGLPWYISDDLKHFKETTLNSCVIMGYNTWKTLQKPLNNRFSIVLTSQKFGIHDNVYFLNSMDLACQIGYILYERIFLIGGSRLISDNLHHIDQLIITHIDMDFDGSIYLNIDLDSWCCIHKKKLNSYCVVKYYMRFQ